MKDNKEFIQGIYDKYDEYLKDEKNAKKLNTEKINTSKKKIFTLNNIKKLSAVAACAVIVSGVVIGNNLINQGTMIGSTQTSSSLSLKTINDFETFYKIAKEDAEKNKKSSRYMYEDIDLAINADTMLKGATADQSASVSETTSQSQSSASSQTRSEDYSKTNIQVEDVDEADIVKTNGNYIFYVVQNKIVIVDIQNKEKMEKRAEISFKNDDFTTLHRSRHWFNALFSFYRNCRSSIFWIKSTFLKT